MDIISVGKSELAGRTFGKEQTMERGAGLQVIGFMNEVQQQTGYRLTPNEGRRSRTDQQLVWNEYALFLAGRGPWAPKAAKPFTSRHDEINHGNAIDFGGPGGAVIPASVHAVMVRLGPKYGVVWTGKNFNEWWHFEASRSNAQFKVPEGTVRTGSAAPAPAPAPNQEEDEMLVIGIKGAKNAAENGVFMVNLGNHTKWNIIRGCASVQQAFDRLGVWQRMGIKYYADQAPWVLAGFTDITGKD